MQELLSRLNNDLVILAADPNLQLYAEICAGISVTLFAIALVMYARKNGLSKMETTETENMAPSQAQSDRKTKKGLHYA